MLKISDTLEQIIEENGFLNYAMSEDIINISKLARMLQPLVAARTKKEVQTSAIVMSLARLNKKKHEKKELENTFVLDNININSGLAVISFNNSTTLNKLDELYLEIKKQNGYITTTHGNKETTIITEERYIDFIIDSLKQEPVTVYKNISAVGVSFSEKYLAVPGLVSSVIQSISMQNINLIEVASTHTELILYIKSQDRSLCFDTLQRKFLK